MFLNEKGRIIWNKIASRPPRWPEMISTLSEMARDDFETWAISEGTAQSGG
jgi:hypothetical protein